MFLASRLFSRLGLPAFALAAFASPLFAQQPAPGSNDRAAVNLPQAPEPQVDAAPVASSLSQAHDPDPSPSQSPQSPPQPPPTAAPAPPSQGSSSSQTPPAQTPGTQTPAPQAEDQKTRQLSAEEQLKIQEKQRVMGVMATFNTTTDRNALPLSPKQKFQLFFRGEIDPWPFALASVVAGIGMADDSYPAWGYGAQGYAKRFGAAYSDAFIGNFFGNAVLTSLLHEDPRYFQKGTGSGKKRFLWAAASTVWCRRDNGSWGPNYANVGGNLIGAAIARIYYPASERTVGDTIDDGLTVSVEGIVGAEVIEFWPDIARHYKRKHAEKLARQAAQGNPQPPATDAPKN